MEMTRTGYLRRKRRTLSRKWRCSAAIISDQLMAIVLDHWFLFLVHTFALFGVVVGV